MTSRFFFFVLFFGSDVGGVVVVVVWRHPEALLFSVCVLADDTLSLVLFLDIYIYNGIGKMQSNLLSPILHSRHETLCDDEYSLSLPKTNETLFWSSLLLLTTTTTISSSLKVVSFLIHTYKMRTRSTTNRTHVVLSVLKGVMTDDDGARRPTQRRQFWRRRLWRTKKRRKPSSSFSPRKGRDETHYLDYPLTVL